MKKALLLGAMAFLAINIAAVQTANAQIKVNVKDAPVTTTTTSVDKPNNNLHTATPNPVATKDQGKEVFTKDAKTESEVKAGVNVQREPVSVEKKEVFTKDAKTEKEVKGAVKKERKMIKPGKMNPSAINGSVLASPKDQPTTVEPAPSNSSKHVLPSDQKPKKPADPKKQTADDKVKTDK